MIGLDYETYSSVDLKTRGLDNYVKSPDFRVLCASFSSPGVGTFTYDWVFGCIRDPELSNTALPVPDVTAEFARFWLADSEEIVAHNAPFERAVTQWIDSELDTQRIVDSAVAASALGAERSLAQSSRQLTDTHKLETGLELIKLFCVPNEQYPNGPTAELIVQHGHMHKWLEFIHYCEVDAKGSRQIRINAQEWLDEFDPELLQREDKYEWVTHTQNQNGWGVDTELVAKMKQRAWANSIIAQRAFTQTFGESEEEQAVNFNSHQQLRQFCETRGVTFKSLDKYNLPVVLNNVKDRIANMEAELKKNEEVEVRMDSHEYQYANITRAIGMLKEVEALLETKAEIGGSTLSKLPVILDLTGPDGILRNQYVHLGAPQTFRTTGRGVQMQNLKKLDGNIREMETLYDFQEHWSNGDMAGQLRQVFRSRHPDGQTIVGDFSAVESRGLAYEAGEEWKLDAYREGLDVYKVLVTKYMGIDYNEVTAQQRPRGKYSELSCGYQASGAAVQDFMFRLGFSVTIEDAAQNVVDWRGANPEIVKFWDKLDQMLKDSVRFNERTWVELAYGMKAVCTPFALPSMQAQHPGSVSLCLQIMLEDGSPYVTRFIHGAYLIQHNNRDKICYYKAEDNPGKALWKASYKHPKTGKDTLYSIYGGKLAGIFTQSLCREMFMESSVALYEALKDVPNALMCGQFHDELVIDWFPSEEPNALTSDEVKQVMAKAMSTTRLRDFPLTADIKGAYRYIK